MQVVFVAIQAFNVNVFLFSIIADVLHEYILNAFIQKGVPSFGDPNRMD